MRGRLRYLIALGFVLLFVLAPAPDAHVGRPYVAWLQVRGWLLGADSPLAAWVADGALPPLAVTLRQSPPIEDAALLRERTAEYERLGAEWARVHDVAVRPAIGALPLEVRIGERGVRATTARPDGQAAVFEAAFPGRASLLPACLTIVVALVFRRVVLALLLGGIAGAIAFAWSGTPPGVAAFPGVLLDGTWHFFADALWRRAVCSDFHLRITFFVVCLFMTIGVVTSNGGVHGAVRLMQRRVRSRRSAQLTAWLTGLLISFDDYTNCMVTGTTMRPLTDSHRISREKLAYIVDATAAPAAGICLFSTWIFYEISQFRAPLALVTDPTGRPYTEDDAYAVFLATLPFRFYCFLALALIPLVILLRRDFGPMLAAERRACASAPAHADDANADTATLPADRPDPDVPLRAGNGLVPVLLLVVGAAVAILGFGVMSDVALAMASAAALGCAVIMTLAQRLLTAARIVVVCLRSVRALVPAFAILFLAWTLGHVSADLGTSYFLCAAARGAMVAAALPLVLFLLSGLIAFATGTSFTTMAILLPNVVVLAHQLGTESAFLGDATTGGPALMLLSIGAVLEGAIFGDHCSPISDTTVLSSLGSRCDHLAHVATQLPYALLTATGALLCGYLPMVLLGPAWWPLSYGAALLLFAGVLLLLGRDPARAITSSA